MQITANEHHLAIDYKLKGKRYNASPFVVALDPSKASTYAFDTEILAPHQTWQLPAGAELVQIRELST